MKWLKWIYDSKTRLFLSFWLLLFLIYLPAWRAGFVSDFTGWLYDLQNSTFAEHINRTHFKVKSLYQFTQLVTWFFYQLFGINHFLWHCLHISLQAINITLFFTVCSSLWNKETEIKPIILAACFIYCISPNLSEVIVWEASFHYLLGFLLLLLQLRFIQLFQGTGHKKWIVYSLLLFLLSSFSIELFYITAFCSLALIIFHYQAVDRDKSKFQYSLLYLFLPQLGLLILHFVLVKISYGHWLPHIGSDTLRETAWNIIWSKPIKLLFHLLFLGRFYSQEFRDKIYLLCESYKVILAFYGSVIIALFLLLKFSKQSFRSKSAFVFLLVWCAISIGLILPLWFPQTLWVLYDRYAYFSMGLIFLMICLFIYWTLALRIGQLLLLIFAAANLFALYKVNRKWQLTEQLTDELMRGLPSESNKKVLLLNMPHFMNGVFMIPANHQNEAQLIRNMLYSPKINYELIDVCANNIMSVKDGAHVKVVNDTTVQVMLNQWETWFWFNDFGATDMDHPYFSRKMVDNGYMIILKGNVSDYSLLYQTGNQWKEVDWTIRDKDQY